jgi:hypothetical protein
VALFIQTPIFSLGRFRLRSFRLRTHYAVILNVMKDLRLAGAPPSTHLRVGCYPSTRPNSVVKSPCKNMKTESPDL